MDCKCYNGAMCSHQQDSSRDDVLKAALARISKQSQRYKLVADEVTRRNKRLAAATQRVKQLSAEYSALRGEAWLCDGAVSG